MSANATELKENEKKKLSYIIFWIIFVMITVTSSTYAYFALTASNNTTIVGTAGTTSLDLKVERLRGTGLMVPQLEEYLSSAISTEYNCIDGNGNTVCQVYKATLTNNSTSAVRLNGTIKFSGIDNMPNLKWKRIENERTIGEYDSKTASVGNVMFESARLFEKNASYSYYFVIWINETGKAQTDNGTFNVSINFSSADGNGLTSTIRPDQQNAFASDIMSISAESDINLDFSQTSSVSNTNGIYVRAGTENNTYPIYYYRGAVNNNLIFADTCWKVVRTTETGGLKILYNGLPNSGQCNNTGSASNLSIKLFNDSSSSFESLAYVGYMYSNAYVSNEKNMSSVTDTYVYGNDVTYSNGKYTLTSTITGSNWGSLYNGGLSNNHYTCFSNDTTCSNVYYIHHTSDTHAYYITLSGGENIEQALTKMLGTDDNNTANYNTISSTIKGSNTIEGTIDYWYYTNIDKKGYSDYLEDTVWCNDRSVISNGGFNPDGGATYYGDLNSSGVIFSSYTRYLNSTPMLSCSRNIDKFTVSESNGNGDLDYPVGLLTLDEVMLAGGGPKVENKSYYLYTGMNYWTGSAAAFYKYNAYVTYQNMDGGYDFNFTSFFNSGVRPAISLKPGFTISGGNGTTTTPYIVS